MIIRGSHETEIFEEKFPFRIAVNYEDCFDYPEHWHRAVEIIYVIKSNFDVIVNGQKYFLNEKDILFIPEGELHQFETKSSQGERAFIQFDLTMMEGFRIDVVKPFLRSLLYFSADSEVNHKLQQQLMSMMQTYEKKDFAYAMSINARIYDLIVIISRYLETRSQSLGAQNQTLNMIRLNKIFTYIDNNYYNQITLKDAAIHCGFSEYHFSRIFNSLVGKGFTKYLNEYRINKAAKLVSSEVMSLTQIAYDVGFNSITTFNRAFKEVKGCNPTQYKKSDSSVFKQYL